MKSNTFIQGAFIATFGIIISKILGIIYVIPFYVIIGEQGGALYGYAYSLYNIFLAISTIGLPIAVSKIVSEYNTLGYYNCKERAYKIALKIIIIMSIISFLILFICAPLLAQIIMGNVTGGNSKEDITLVLRVSSLAIIFVATLSVLRGYLQGHKFITPSSISQIIEQLARVILIIFGSYVALKIFRLGLPVAVSVAVFGATFGAIIAVFYLKYKIKRNKKNLKTNYQESIKEGNITNRQILKKLLKYSLPLVAISVITSSYEIVDTMTVVKTLVNDTGFNTIDAEAVISVISTWGSKLNMIVTSVASGIIVSLIPNITSSNVSNNKKDVGNKINQTIQMILLISLPMTIGLSFLAVPVWGIFYGYESIGPLVIKFSIFTAFTACLSTSMIMIAQALNEYKLVLISLVSGITLKIVLNVPLMILFNKISLPPYYGAITATIIGSLTVTIFNLIWIGCKRKINYINTLKQSGLVLLSCFTMVIIMYGTTYILPLNIEKRFISIIVVIIYTIVGGLSYLFVAHKTNIIKQTFGNNIYNKIPIIRKYL
ncbi:MAG: polysaccharide biosynthesis protein [Bacilli bacterium]